jgi:hypothetical protein
MSAQPQKQITRIDLEAVGNDGHLVRVSQWREGWQEGDAPEVSELVDGKSIMFHMMDYEKQGYTCEMASVKLGRALRGKTTRIDFIQKEDGWHIQKFPYGWTAKTRPLTDVIKTAEETEAAIVWCEQNRWTVYRINESKARAWRGEPQPVHDAKTIMRMRANAKAEGRDFFVDFAFSG